jgi:hypothetical protein
MILLARIEDVRATSSGRLLVTAGYWVSSSPTASGNVSFTCDVMDADSVRAEVIAACTAQAAADFGIDPDSLTNSSVL